MNNSYSQSSGYPMTGRMSTTSNMINNNQCQSLSNGSLPNRCTSNHMNTNATSAMPQCCPPMQSSNQPFHSQQHPHHHHHHPHQHNHPSNLHQNHLHQQQQQQHNLGTGAVISNGMNSMPTGNNVSNGGLGQHQHPAMHHQQQLQQDSMNSMASMKGGVGSACNNQTNYGTVNGPNINGRMRSSTISAATNPHQHQHHLQQQQQQFQSQTPKRSSSASSASSYAMMNNVGNVYNGGNNNSNYGMPQQQPSHYSNSQVRRK